LVTGRISLWNQRLPSGHYENFPVASWLLPKALREPVALIYRFARSADDIADEGEAGPNERLARLAAYGEELDRIAAGSAPRTAPFRELARIVNRHALPIPLFRDLLSAFAQDVVTPRYADAAQLLDYCRRSANPIGRLLLQLFGRTERIALERSDAICSSLQLINFWQDVARWSKGRVICRRTRSASASAKVRSRRTNATPPGIRCCSISAGAMMLRRPARAHARRARWSSRSASPSRAGCASSRSSRTRATTCSASAPCCARPTGRC
jgi:squalene synthase HpnC